MEKNTDVTIKNALKNYLRELYVELSKEELIPVKKFWSSIKDSIFWCGVIENPNFFKSLMGYYLIAKKCPEFTVCSTLDLVEMRFANEDIRNLINFQGIVILRHSSGFVRNKLMLETLTNVVSERVYKNLPILVVSDVALDQGDFVYYDQSKIQKLMNIHEEKISEKSGATTPKKSRSAATGSRVPMKIYTRPATNTNTSKKTREQEIRSRQQSIERSTHAI